MAGLELIEAEKKEVKFLDDPLFSVIVPVYDVPPMVFKRCLMSLRDQDYENKEVILVFDGSNPELERIADPFDFKKMIIDHAGACAARNAGFKESKGEIVSFFNSDYVAKPGMIRMWVDRLLEHPECGFVYGGYEFASSHRSYVESGKFDPRLLEVENYIDCGFPLWRKYVVEWDTNCKSLQDWDFWIRVIKTHQVKGFYLGRDYSFIAELPRPKGLSIDSSTHWNDRVSYVKEKNGIAQRDLLVDSIGAPNHAVEIAKLLDADFRIHTWHKTDWISTYKALYMIGFYIKPNEGGLNEHARRLAIFKDKNPEVKRIVHFVGADIYWLRKFPYDSLKYLAGALKGSCDAILSENEAAQKELLDMGIPSQVVPIPSYSEWEVKPLPDKFTVSIFVTDRSDFDKYLKEHTLSIVRAMPDVNFTYYGDGADDVRYPNLKNFGIIPRVEWPDYVYKNSALLRICRHDTLPMASCEFLMAGRDVVTNITMPMATNIPTGGKTELNEWDHFSEGFNPHHWPGTKKRIIQEIRRLKKGTMSEMARTKVSDYYKTLLDKQTYISKIKELSGL